MNGFTGWQTLWRQCLLAQVPGGRALLRLGIRSRRLLWRLSLASGPILKRALDIVGSGLALLAVSPLFAWVALCIKIEDGGPVFFAQTRVGRHGREFKMFKFRSMILNAESRLQDLLNENQHHEGVTFKIKNDPRVTRVGRLLRRFSLDEFPQFYNVLRGDMSLVGPRPPVPREVALYSPSDRRRLFVTPGLSCLWQIGGRSEIDFSDQVQLDVRYIESQSFWVDVKILVQTVPAVLSGRGAC